MKSTHCIVLLLLFALLACSIVPIFADEDEKKKKEDPCKQCYDKKEGCCYDWNNNNGHATCFDKKTHQCNGGHRLCPKGLKSCGKDCYSTKLYYCYDHKLIPIPENKCLKKKGGCGKLKCCPTEHHKSQCYNPNHQKCTPKGLIWKCHEHWGDHPDCCSGRGECHGNDKCKCDFGYTGKRCEKRKKPKCNCTKKTDKCCHDLNNNNGNPTCYDPATHQCNHGNRLCPKGKASCKKDCYDKKQYRCEKGKLVQRKDKKPKQEEPKHDTL